MRGSEARFEWRKDCGGGNEAAGWGKRVWRRECVVVGTELRSEKILQGEDFGGANETAGWPGLASQHVFPRCMGNTVGVKFLHVR